MLHTHMLFRGRTALSSNKMENGLSSASAVYGLVLVQITLISPVAGDVCVTECTHTIVWLRYTIRHEGKSKLNLLAGNGIAVKCLGNVMRWWLPRGSTRKMWMLLWSQLLDIYRNVQQGLFRALLKKCKSKHKGHFFIPNFGSTKESQLLNFLNIWNIQRKSDTRVAYACLDVLPMTSDNARSWHFVARLCQEKRMVFSVPLWLTSNGCW